MKTVAIIPAAGLGTRMGKASSDGEAGRKQFLLLDGAPILLHTIRKFVQAESIDEILVALRADDVASVQTALDREQPTKPVRLVEGGHNRQESVRNCLREIAADVDLVAVHDAVRPFITPALIDAAVAEAAKSGAVILGMPAVETVKQVSQTVIESTLLRERIMLAQTPQVFRAELLQRASAQAEQDGFTSTDEASLVEHLGEDVHVMRGSDRNIKITRPGDLAVAELFYREEQQALAEQQS